MRLKRHIGAIGFSNEKFLELMAIATGVQPVGELGRETPLDFTSLEAARGSVLLSELFSKYDDGQPSEEKERTTWKKFQEAETACEATNLRAYSTFTGDPFWVNVRRRIANALGVFSWDECAKDFGFGPGATTRLTRSENAAAYKYSGIPESTSGNADLADCAIRMSPLWTSIVLDCYQKDDRGYPPNPRGLCKIVPGNSIIAVPKNYKTNRTIAKEPCMNIYIQKGIGRAIRRRLYRVGVDLNDQRINQWLAYQGSITGKLATVDLSMASDTIAKEVVGWLLPIDWWSALEQCRSPVGVLPSGEVIRYQKFSSMGNGFTFELESLIFWAIAQQVAVTNVNEMEMLATVYGDDIVIPSQFCAELIERLSQAGFTANLKKTHYEGHYRESCGKHYYHGADITPFYVRKPVQKLDRLFLVHNNVYRWEDRTGVDTAKIREDLRRLAPAAWREPRLPDGYGDGAFIGAVDELRLDSHPHGWDCWQVKVLQQSSKLLQDNLPDGQVLASLKASATRQPVVMSSAFLQMLDEWIESAFPGKTPSAADHSLDEVPSGLPAKEGPFRELTLSIPRRPRG